jgi:hypothetical protein
VHRAGGVGDLHPRGTTRTQHPAARCPTPPLRLGSGGTGQRRPGHRGAALADTGAAAGGLPMGNAAGRWCLHGRRGTAATGPPWQPRHADAPAGPGGAGSTHCGQRRGRHSARRLEHGVRQHEQHQRRHHQHRAMPAPARYAGQQRPRIPDRPGGMQVGAVGGAASSSRSGMTCSGSRSSTGAGSIFSVRQTLLSQGAREHGVRQQVEPVGLQRLQLLHRHLQRTASAPMCRPAASRASRSRLPALSPAGAGPAQPRSVRARMTRSVIERPTLQLAGFR